MRLEKLSGRGLEYLFVDPQSGIIYFRRYTKGQGEVFKSLKTKEKSAAKEARDALVGSKEAVIKKPRVKLALDLFDEWFEMRKIEDISAATKTSIAASRAHLAPFLEVMRVEEITSLWWANTYIKKVREKTHAKRKFFNDRKWLVAFLRSMVEQNELQKIPKLVNPDPKARAGKVFTDDDVSALLNFAQNDDLRHTFLTKAFKAPGANAALICTYAGLTLEVAQEVYLHLNENDTAAVAELVTYAA